MDLVILDHHQMADRGPETAITISPQLNGDGTYHDLTAAGVAYLLVCALAERGIPVVDGPGKSPARYLDLVALGTIADVSPLVGVNRLIVHKGLDLVRSGRRPGIAALMRTAGQEPPAVTASTVSFSLAPRLNSAGRIGSPTLAFDLLLSRDRRHADTLARALEELNAKRRIRSAQVLAEAYAAVSRQSGWETRSVLAAHNPGWESGLVGAVASRMAEETRRPVFLFRNANGVLSGSARSVEGFNLVSSLAGIAEILLNYGGHSLAAGVTIREEHLPSMESRLAEAMRQQGITTPAPRLVKIDANLPANCISLQTVRDLSRMEPFGRGNAQPLLRIRDACLVKYSTMGKEREHLKIVVQTGGRNLDAISWRGAERSKELVMRHSIDLVGRLETNTWNGQERLQFVIEDFRAE
jgi:single-stranded-DNA-specific exonuclease